MGYNTSVLILNDGLNEIENDPEFGKKLVAGILQVQRGKPVTIPVGGFANPVVVVETHHADQNVVVAFGGNYVKVLGNAGNYRATPEQMLRALAEDMGFRLIKKSSPRKK
jgi:hypothetical protein